MFIWMEAGGGKLEVNVGYSFKKKLIKLDDRSG